MALHVAAGNLRSRPSRSESSLGLNRATPLGRVSMGGYYRSHLVGPRLQQVYEVASPRIRQYLRAEIGNVVDQVRDLDRVLELGCGYGRVLAEVAPYVRRTTGIDIARGNLQWATSYLRAYRNCDLALMNAVRLGFQDARFDATICVQNGVSAFGVDRSQLVAEAIRVTKEGGRILFSTYSPRFWAERLDWFRAQARAGLVGELDASQTTEGTIVCQDGLRLTTTSGEEFRALFGDLGQQAEIREIDGSSIFAEVTKRPSARRPR